MRFLFLILFASLGAHAGERYAAGGDLVSAMDAYARAANLQPLKQTGDDELRVWTFDFMGGQVEGYVISTGSAIKCRSSYHYKDGVVSIDRARCRRWHKGEDALDAIDTVTALDGKRWNCPMSDGGGAYVEGMRNGRRFAFEVDNPGACDDPGSKALVDLLAKLW